MRLTLNDIGENNLIERISKLLGESFLGGDDCAAISPQIRPQIIQLLKTDALIETIHFLPEEAPQRVGHKAIARVLSDFAAMGGSGDEFLVTIALRPDTYVDWVLALYQGMNDCLSQFGGRIVGGETVAVPHGTPLMISVSATGSAPLSYLKKRSSGQQGDLLCVTGSLGGSLRGKHLDFTPRLREGQWLGQQEEVHAMMDLSDGLAKDLPRLAQASSCGFHLDFNCIPRAEGCDLQAALSDGEDYELLCSIAPTALPSLLDRWAQTFPALPLHCIGSLVSPEKSLSLQGGWEHFSS